MNALPFYIPRAEMPQIDNVPACLDWCRDQGFAALHHRATPASRWRNHQHVLIDPARAALIPPSALAAPILTALDGFIIDGNHRWAICRARGLPLEAYELLLDFGEAMTLLARYPGKRSEGGEL